MKLVDMKGRRYGGLTVIERVGTSKSRDAIWSYLCDCGRIGKSTGYSIRSGKTTNCPKCSLSRCAAGSITHGETSSAEYRTWTDMKTRCLNPMSTSYEKYGGRGITVCDRWSKSFAAFLHDMGRKPSPGHSIDRIDNDKGYSPTNCRWATDYEQVMNRRNTIFVTIGGIKKTLVEWCEIYGCTPASAYLRRSQGFIGEAIFKTTKMTITFSGITDTVSGWSSRTGIRPTTITMRINKYGWSIDRALTEGATKCA
ncbi:hypothetical protein LMG33810_002885 [Carnimonas sp. LMG 33810]